MATSDLTPLATQLDQLLRTLKDNDIPETWQQVERVSNAIANGLRVRDPAVDNHTALGKGNLPMTLTELLKLALRDSPVPSTQLAAAAILELLRIAANLCLDHDANRGHLLDAGVPQAVVGILEGYADEIPGPDALSLQPLPLITLKVVRTAIGVLLNASIACDAVKSRLNSLEAPLTLLKIGSFIYPPMSWYNSKAKLTEDGMEEWVLRTGISSWAWRTLSDLNDVKDESKDDASRQVLGVDALPWITPTLSHFIPPYHEQLDLSWTEDPEFYRSMVQTDFEILEETCTLLESISLDIEDIRLALARGYCFPAEHLGVSCFKTMIDFIERGGYPITWKHSCITPEERARKQKTFDMCKGALIKAVVEVSGEEKNEDVLWDDSDEARPGGDYVWTMVRWIKSFVTDMEKDSSIPHRDDLVICATLSLGNLARRAKTSKALLEPPLSLGPAICSKFIFSPETDVKLKHGVLGLLKHIAQSAPLAAEISELLAAQNLIRTISESEIWDGSDNMAAVVQSNAIGVVKHLCHASITHAIATSLPYEGAPATYKTPLERILSLSSRSEHVPIKSEGVRVLVNVIRTLLLRKSSTGSTEKEMAASQEQKRQRKAAIGRILNEENVKILAWFLARSGKHAILINEAVVGLNLLCPEQNGGELVLDAILSPTPEASLNEVAPQTPVSEASSAATLVNKPPRPPVSRHGLEMLASVLRNTENPVSYPAEIRANVCTFLIHLTRHTSGNTKLQQVQDSLKPVLQNVKESSTKEEMLSSAVDKVLDLWK